MHDGGSAEHCQAGAWCEGVLAVLCGCLDHAHELALLLLLLLLD